MPASQVSIVEVSSEETGKHCIYEGGGCPSADAKEKEERRAVPPGRQPDDGGNAPESGHRGEHDRNGQQQCTSQRKAERDRRLDGLPVTAGAAGGIEAVFSAMAIHDQVAPPTINLLNPGEGCDLDYVPGTAREMKIDVAVSNSFGFGGTNGTLVFRKLTD